MPVCLPVISIFCFFQSVTQNTELAVSSNNACDRGTWYSIILPYPLIVFNDIIIIYQQYLMILLYLLIQQKQNTFTDRTDGDDADKSYGCNHIGHKGGYLMKRKGNA